MKNGKEKSMFVREYLWRDLMTVCGLFVILLTIVIGAFLVYKGSSTFLVYRHSFMEFLGSADWAPEDNMAGGGSIGALIFIAGSLCTRLLSMDGWDLRCLYRRSRPCLTVRWDIPSWQQVWS